MMTALHYPSIDRLLNLYKSESKPFFTSLKSSERKELRKYTNYQKAQHKDNWSFSPYTVATLERVDRQAAQFYLQHLKYKQLTISWIQCKDSMNLLRKSCLSHGYKR